MLRSLRARRHSWAALLPALLLLPQMLLGSVCQTPDGDAVLEIGGCACLEAVPASGAASFDAAACGPCTDQSFDPAHHRVANHAAAAIPVVRPFALVIPAQRVVDLPAVAEPFRESRPAVLRC